MKKIITLLLTITFPYFGYSQTIAIEDSLGLPGDNLNLYAVLDLFQNSKTFESFEKKLNEEDSKINNLDLNNDGKTDYIKVIDHKEGDTHSVVLQVAVNENENQDIAVIEIEKDKNNTVRLQIVGNDELYGKNYIVEPQLNDSTIKATVDTPNPAAKQDKTVVVNTTTTNNYSTTNTKGGNGGAYLSVSYWPMIGYMYAPAYVGYSSPWYWNTYPAWWQPWTPRHWRNYYWHHTNYRQRYHNYYHRTVVYRNEVAHSNYAPRRSISTTVQKNRVEGVYVRNYNSVERSNAPKIRRDNTNPAYELKHSNRNKQQPSDIRENKRNQNISPDIKQQNNRKVNTTMKPQQRQQQPNKQHNNKPRGGATKRK